MNKTTVTVTSDLHGFRPKLPGGDLLIVAGDLTASETEQEHVDFVSWLSWVPYDKVIYIAGNHDTFYERSVTFVTSQKIKYLCDSGTEYKGLKIWGSPWTLNFLGINPHCMAFTVNTEKEILEKFSLIPEDTDILVTHSPAYGILDRCTNSARAGSAALRRVLDVSDIDFVIHGHIHEGYGKYKAKGVTFINASHVNESYQPVNEPITVEI